MSFAKRVDYLNNNYSGFFRLLNEQEVSKYSLLLNKGISTENEYYTPYAIREETMEIVTKYDSTTSYNDYLFKKVTN